MMGGSYMMEVPGRKNPSDGMLPNERVPPESVVHLLSDRLLDYTTKFN